jgi:hypothetical protein
MDGACTYDSLFQKTNVVPGLGCFQAKMNRLLCKISGI